MAGRPRKPRHVKESQGTLEKSREIDIYLKFTKIATLPDPPVGLNEDGRNLWNHTIYSLNSVNVLSPVWLPEIYEYCKTYELYMRASNELDVKYEQTFPTGAKQILPAFTIWKETRKALSEFRAKYGLDLVNSQKIGMPKKQNDLLK